MVNVYQLRIDLIKKNFESDLKPHEYLELWDKFSRLSKYLEFLIKRFENLCFASYLL